jgi:hypothetical protein
MDADARGSLVAFSANERKSLSFAVVGGSPVRRFPIYTGEGVGAAPTGKTRQLQYELVPGEAGWLLKLDRTTDF